MAKKGRSGERLEKNEKRFRKTVVGYSIECQREMTLKEVSVSVRP